MIGRTDVVYFVVLFQLLHGHTEEN